MEEKNGNKGDNNDSTQLVNSDNWVATAPTKPMNWHRFLIYFALWIAALSWAFQAMQYYVGSLYGSYNARESVYAAYPGLHMLNTVFAGVCVVACIFSIATRFALAKYKVNAPGMLIRLYLFNLCANPAYIVAVFLITRINLIAVDTIVDMFLTIVMILINYSYYEKRMDMFVN